MTERTPRQLRDLADGEVNITEKPHAEVTTLYDFRAALRDAADQLERQGRALDAAKQFQVGEEVTRATGTALGT